jgi:hypothetical protein
MMRRFACAALAAAILAGMSFHASAATIVEDFTIAIGGDADQNFLSSVFAGFDPSLGALTGAAISLSGSPTWTPGTPPAGASDEVFTVALVSPFFAFQNYFSFHDAPEVIEIDLAGAASGAAIRSGPQQELLKAFDSTDGGTVSDATLDGAVTYTFVPVTPSAPEPTTWAMMLLGFAGLGYLAVARRRGLSREA